MPDDFTPTAKHAEAARRRDLTRTAVAEAIRLADAGDRDAAEKTAVHAYHDGAPAMALLDEYHTQRCAQEATT